MRSHDNDMMIITITVAEYLAHLENEVTTG